MTHSWRRHQMETFSALVAVCAGNSPVPGEFPAQRPVTWSFDAFFDLRLSKRLNKQSPGWWFETLSRPLWRHSNVLVCFVNHFDLIHSTCTWYYKSYFIMCYQLSALVLIFIIIDFWYILPEITIDDIYHVNISTDSWV